MLCMADEQIYPNRIRECRKALDLTIEEVALRMPSQPAVGSVARWEKGERQPRQRYLNELAGVLGTTPADLLRNDQAPNRRIPILGKITAGNWREAVEDPVGEMSVDLDTEGENAFGLIVDGDSMDKIAPDGSKVVVNPDDRDLHDKRVYAMANDDGETTFKRYMSSPARLEPCSTNEAHKPIMVSGQPFTVIGRVTRLLVEL